MIDRDPPRDPERLSRDPALAGLIEQANGAYRAGIDEHAAFQRLSERLQPPPRRAKWQHITLGAALGFAAAAALVLKFSSDTAPPVAFGPELSSARRAAANAERALPESDTLHDSDSPLESAADKEPATARDERATTLEKERAAARERTLDEPDRNLDDGARRLDKAPRDGALRDGALRDGALRDGALRDGALREPPLEHGPDTRPPKSTRSNETDGGPRPEKLGGGSPTRPSDSLGENGSSPTRPVDTRVDCLDMARQGEPRAAEQCFGQRASGTGLSAEMALYEMARLRRDVLRDGSGALSALDDYRQRFPQGSLRHEVDITRVELLSDLGQGRQALRESEALLASATGRERAAELHMLRGNIYRRDLNDWKAAADEYAQAETFGGTAGAEATRLRGVSLEALGDAAAALAAYRRYLDLDGADSARKVEVKRRVEALSGGAERPAAP